MRQLHSRPPHATQPSQQSPGWRQLKLILGLLFSTALLVVVLPLFDAFLLEAEVDSASRTLMREIAQARLSAIAGNRRVQWIVYPYNPNTTGGPMALEVSPNGASEVTFNVLGWSVANADGTPTIASIDVQPGSWLHKGLHRRRLILSSAGSIVLCDPGRKRPLPFSC